MDKHAGTDLYLRTIAANYGDEENRKLMGRVWSVTPWMANVFTDNYDSERATEIRDWCRERFGDEALPIHGRAGRWQLGLATVYGWNWIGFSREEELLEFLGKFGGSKCASCG